MALAYDTKNNVAGSGTITVPLTIDATAKVIVIGISAAANDANRAGGAPTWNTTETFTQIGSTITGYKECQAEMWYCIPATTGTHNVSVPNTGSDALNVIASAYKGATACVLDQSTSTNAGGAAGANPSCTLNNVPNGSAVVDCLADGYASVPTGNSDTLLYALDNTAWNDAGQYVISPQQFDICNYATHSIKLYSGSIIANSQSFQGQAKTLDKVIFSFYKTLLPTGNIIVKLYDHSGTYGTSSVPTGGVLATSDSIDVSTFDGFNRDYTFTFSTPYTLSVGTNYCIVAEYTSTFSNASNYVNQTGTTPTQHSGNLASYISSWTADSTYDLRFILFSYNITLSYTQVSDDVAMIMASFKESAPWVDTLLTGVTYMES